MQYKHIKEEIAKQLNISSESVRRVKKYTGSSPASICEITFGKQNERAILKDNTTKTEWLIYKIFQKYPQLPIPKVLAMSPTMNVPWILIKKVPKGMHPAKWTTSEFTQAIKTLAQVHATFYNKPIQEEFFDIKHITATNWQEVKDRIAERLEKTKKTAQIQKNSFPLTVEDIETITEIVYEKNFAEKMFKTGISLIHGDPWAYNFFISKQGVYLIDWQVAKISSPAWEVLHFYDYSRIFAEGLKIALKPPPLSLEAIKDIYLTEMQEQGVQFNSEDFDVAVKAAAAFHMAYHWPKRVKPYAFYLKGGRYFISTVLRLFPDRKTVRQHFQELLKIATE